jgi:hypothetical protein
MFRCNALNDPDWHLARIELVSHLGSALDWSVFRESAFWSSLRGIPIFGTLYASLLKLLAKSIKALCQQALCVQIIVSKANICKFEFPV